jgi:hypothetical protein
MDNPDIVETLVKQDTGIVYLVSCVTNVSSISELSILHCNSVFLYAYLPPILCPISYVSNVSSISGLSILDCPVTQDTGHTIGSK